MKKFYLLKDLPNCPKGAIGEEKNGFIEWHRNGGYSPFSTRFVSCHPDWFEEVVEKVDCPICHGTTDYYNEYHQRRMACPHCSVYIIPKLTPKKIEPINIDNTNYGEMVEMLNILISAINEMRGAV